MPGPYEAFQEISDNYKPLTRLKIEIYCSSESDETPNMENANEILKEFNLRTGRESKEFYKLTDVILLAYVFRNF